MSRSVVAGHVGTGRTTAGASKRPPSTNMHQAIRYSQSSTKSVLAHHGVIESKFNPVVLTYCQNLISDHCAVEHWCSAVNSGLACVHPCPQMVSTATAALKVWISKTSFTRSNGPSTTLRAIQGGSRIPCARSAEYFTISAEHHVTEVCRQQHDNTR